MSEEKEETQNEEQEQTPKNTIDPKTMAEIRQQVVEELKKEQQSDVQRRNKEREQERKAHEEYVEQMKRSEDPWVEVIGMAETQQGVRVELEWNDAFVNYLRENGVSGTDDEQVIQRWVTLLLRDMADQMEGGQESTYE